MPKSALLSLVLVGTTALAAGKPLGQLFQYKDWEVACDNTRRCQAAGYAPEGGLDGVNWEPIGMLITREAGPGTPVEIQFLIPQDEVPGVKPRGKGYLLHMESLKVPGVQPGVALPAAAAKQVLGLIGSANDIRLERGDEVRHLSLAGSNAALLKIDDVQGRVGTPGALMRKGNKPESTVLPPLAAPVVRPVPFAKAKPRDAALAGAVLAAVKARACWDDVPKATGTDGGEVLRVNESRVLVTRLCWQAAYQSGKSAWLASDVPPHAPQPVAFADVDGKDMESPTELSIAAAGTAQAAHKGRGIGDCWDTHSWAWDGARFVLAEASGTGMCRLIPGGIPLRRWTTRQQ